MKIHLVAILMATGLSVQVHAESFFLATEQGLWPCMHSVFTEKQEYEDALNSQYGGTCKATEDVEGTIMISCQNVMAYAAKTEAKCNSIRTSIEALLKAAQ